MPTYPRPDVEGIRERVPNHPPTIEETRELLEYVKYLETHRRSLLDWVNANPHTWQCTAFDGVCCCGWDRLVNQ